MNARKAALTAACAAMLPLLAHADLRDEVDQARMRGCRGPAAAPLRTNARLAAAASGLAQGKSLNAAVSATGYLATETSGLHLSGVAGDSDVGRSLVAADCAVLTNPHLTEMGGLRRGDEVWLVLAAPLTLPSAADATRIVRQILALVNEARGAGRRCGDRAFAPSAPLALDAALTAAARVHSEEMAAHGVFEHAGPDGSSPAVRVTRAGYGRYSIVGENIAAGPMTPADVTQGWLDSRPHCENIMDPRFTHVGIAFAVNPSSAELVYWTQDFAAGVR